MVAYTLLATTMFVLRNVLPSLPGPSPSSIELQTLVEAKESEEPLC